MSKRTTQLLTTVLTVVLVLGVWWLQGRDDASAPDAARDSPSATSTPTDRPTSAPSATRTASSPSASSRPATEAAEDEDGLPYVDLGDLPREAAATVRLIDAGGPFPYPGKDGSTFGNFEGRLPARQRGYYAEYTVPTPGVDHRGARRIIAGDRGELYWTEDHYDSFERIRR